MTRKPAAQRIQGTIEGLYGDLLYGWVIDHTCPDLRVTVELYIDDVFVSVTRADQPQVIAEFAEEPGEESGKNPSPPDANIETDTKASAGDGLHGFAFHVQKNWLQQATNIAVRVANQGPWLPGTIDLQAWGDTPADTTADTPADSARDSHAWYDGGLIIQGWVIDAEDPERHVQVQARQGLTLLAQTTADQPHPTLLKRSSADHGFTLQLPWSLADGALHTLTLENDKGEALVGSPLKVCVQPEGLAALLHATWPGSAKSRQQPPFTTVLQLAQEMERRMPRSLPFNAYPHWFELQQQTPVPALKNSTTRVGALIIDASDTPQPGAAATVASLKQQVIDTIGSQTKSRAKAKPAAKTKAASKTTHSPAIKPAIQPAGIKPTAIQQIVHCAATDAVAGAAELLQHGVDAVLVIQAGDRLAPHALTRLLAAQADTGARWVYGDCDQDDTNGQRSNPWLKPAWDPDLFLGHDIFTNGALITADLLQQAINTLLHHPQSEADDWHHLACALVWACEATAQTKAQAKTNPAQVIHLPMVLLHRAADQQALPHRQPAVQWLAQQWNNKASVTGVPDCPDLLRVQWPLPAKPPRVSLIIPTRDQYSLLSRCITSIQQHTRYSNLQLIVVDNDSRCPRTLAYLNALESQTTQHIKIIRYPHPFNYAAINNLAVEEADGELIGLINNDIEIPADQDHWLHEMVSQLLRPGVGAVGAKLLWSNGMVQHGGVVVSTNGMAFHVGNTWLSGDRGYLGINQLARRQSAVTAACLLTHKKLWRQVDGLNATDFPVNFNDVDYCLKLRQAGYTVLWTPHATLIHEESASRGLDIRRDKQYRAIREQNNLRAHWTHWLPADPSYHPGLSHGHAVFAYGGLRLPPPPVNPRTNTITH